MCWNQTNLCPSSFSTPCADMPSPYTLQSDFWSRIKVGGRLEWEPLPTSSMGHVPAGHSASQGHTAPQGRKSIGKSKVQNEFWQIPGASQPACRYAHTHTDSEDPTQLLSYSCLDFEGCTAETKHESRGSSHKTQQSSFPWWHFPE